MEQIGPTTGRPPAYIGTSAALAAMHTGSQTVVVDRVLLPTGQPATRVRLLSEITPAAPVAPRRPGPPPPWYRRWSPAQILALVAGILAVVAGIVWAVVYALSQLVTAAAGHGKAIAVVLVVLIILAALGLRSGRKFSGTFSGTIR